MLLRKHEQQDLSNTVLQRINFQQRLDDISYYTVEVLFIMEVRNSAMKAQKLSKK